MKRVGIIAGEASGDILGAGLLTELKKSMPLAVTGVGGAAMIQAGCNSLFDSKALAVMGLIEPLMHLPRLWQMRRQLIANFLRHKPDIFIGIDSPDFNLAIEKKCKAAHIPVVHYVSPSVWAWRQGRIRTIATAVDLVLTLFPFEETFYQQHHIPSVCVGHPLADAIPLTPDTLLARQTLGLPSDAEIIALLPGSREQECKKMIPLFVETAKKCLRTKPEVIFITSLVQSSQRIFFEKYCQEQAPQLSIRFFENKSHAVMAAADVVLVTSGTATLETLLFKKPMVIAYQMAAITYQLARYLVKIPFIGLPNILANKALVPEFIQNQAQPEPMAEALCYFLQHPDKNEKLIHQFIQIHQSLRRDANVSAAKAVSELM